MLKKNIYLNIRIPTFKCGLLVRYVKNIYTRMCSQKVLVRHPKCDISYLYSHLLCVFMVQL